jgi:hypothetical protein
MKVRSRRARTAGGPPGRSNASERGSVVVESAIVTPVVLLLVFGMIEAASALSAYSSTAHAVRAAGRVASVAAADPMSDQRVLVRLAREIVGIGDDDVEFVVIWHATGPGDGVPEACLPDSYDTPNHESVGVSDGGFDAIGACNVYLRPDRAGGAFDMATGAATHPPSHYFGCEGDADPGAAHKVDCHWPGKARRALTTPRESAGPRVAPDFVGVHVQVRHSLHTDLVIEALTIRDGTVNLIEPQGYGLT